MSPRKPDEPVRLTRIYTRGGDAGETSLGDGSRVVEARSAGSRVRRRRRAELAARVGAGRGAEPVARADPERAVRRRRRPLGAVRRGRRQAPRDPGGDRPARGGVRRARTRAARAEELRPAGRHRGGGAAPHRARHVPPRRARGAGRARRAAGQPARARLPEPAQRPAVHPRACGERRRARSRSGCPEADDEASCVRRSRGWRTSRCTGRIRAVDYERDLGAPGEFPFTRGVYRVDVSGPAVDDAAVRGVRDGGGDERAVPVSAGAWADGVVDGVRHADADGLRLGSRPVGG